MTNKQATALQAIRDIEKRHGQAEDKKVTVKMLSVRQPWASMITSGSKTIETRGWRTHYRGELVIQAASAVCKVMRHLPVGCALCIVNLVDCRPLETWDEKAAMCQWSPNSFAWVLENIRPLVVPFKVKGQLSIFTREVYESQLITR